MCAVADGQVHRLAQALHPAPRVLSLKARDLAGIWRDIREVGEALDLEDEAEELVLGLQSSMARIRASLGSGPAQGALHRVARPALPRRALGAGAGCRSGWTGRRCTARAVTRPDAHGTSWRRSGRITSWSCCADSESNGHGPSWTRSEDPDALELLRQVPVSIIDGNAYTSRPGPRVVDGASWIQRALRGRTSGGCSDGSRGKVDRRARPRQPATSSHRRALSRNTPPRSISISASRASRRSWRRCPASYAPPAGPAPAWRADTVTRSPGCVALRPLEPDVCEMKRLYVRPAFRDLGAGRMLVESIIREGREAGYRRMRLDTLATMVMPPSICTGSLDFVRSRPTAINPVQGAPFLELRTGPTSRDRDNHSPSSGRCWTHRVRRHSRRLPPGSGAQKLRSFADQSTPT